MLAAALAEVDSRLELLSNENAHLRRAVSSSSLPLSLSRADRDRDRGSPDRSNISFSSRAGGPHAAAPDPFGSPSSSQGSLSLAPSERSRAASTAVASAARDSLLATSLLEAQQQELEQSRQDSALVVEMVRASADTQIKLLEARLDDSKRAHAGEVERLRAELADGKSALSAAHAAHAALTETLSQHSRREAALIARHDEDLTSERSKRSALKRELDEAAAAHRVVVEELESINAGLESRLGRAEMALAKARIVGLGVAQGVEQAELEAAVGLSTAPHPNPNPKPTSSTPASGAGAEGSSAAPRSARERGRR